MASVKKIREDSPFLHPRAGEALVMAASSITEGPRPVAVVLEDGTVRSLEPRRSFGRMHASGLMAGQNWTFWWERRSWAEA